MAAIISYVRLAMLLPVLYIPFLIGGGCTNNWSGAIGLLTGHLFVLCLGWVYAKTCRARESTTDSQTLSKNVTFSVLKNQRRRETLQYLRRAEGTSRLRDLAEYIAAKENDVEPDELTSTQRKRVYTNLYQCHLPMMDDAGIVEYDQNRGNVELLDAASELFKYIDDTNGANTESTCTSWGDLGTLGLTVG